MDFARQIVDQWVRKMVIDQPNWFEGNDENKNISRAFIILGVSSYLGIEPVEAYALLTDGGNDSGVDAIYIGDPDNDNVTFPVVIFQAKYKFNLDNDSHFPANSVLRVVNAIRSIFDPHQDTIMNAALKQNVVEIKTLILDGYIPEIRCVMLNNGLEWNDEGEQHIQQIQNEQISFDHYNHRDIVNQIHRKVQITENIQLPGKSIVEDFNFKRVVIGKMNVKDISILLEKYGDALLEKNIRRHLGIHKNRVNSDIQNTLISDKKSNFYFFNNGITMVCSQFNYNKFTEENRLFNVKDLQIINGGQTSKTILQTLKDNPGIDFSECFVLTRLYELPGEEHEEMLSDITFATNSQNPVDLRDLRANEAHQKELEIGVEQLGYTYKRKRDNTVSFGDTIPSSVAAEAVFSIWRMQPHIAKYKRNELFGKFYQDIFNGLNAAQLIIAVLIYRYCDSNRKRENLLALNPHLPYSNYFMSMIIGKLLLADMNIDLDKLNHKNFDETREYFETNKEGLYQRANVMIINVLDELYPEGYQDIDPRRLSSTFRSGLVLEKLTL
ncbi:AIPR family protein [Paenibacillus xylanexedens]|uniref:AIPR family protein n=1 Tax=Paenibacillus xylanexedens TaxID=528191 RepID=UPI0011A762EA|nr:AIPR family protein [Paenibacillus xylanexedens]